MLKKELVARIIEVVGYELGTESQLMRKTLAQLNIMVEAVVYEDICREDARLAALVAEPTVEPVVCESEEDKTDAVVLNNEAVLRKFDLKRYMNYTIPAHLFSLGTTASQLNLIKSLETNFKVSIDISKCTCRGQVSQKISKVFDAIAQGRVSARSEEEIVARLKSYTKAVVVKPVDISEAAVTVDNSVDSVDNSISAVSTVERLVKSPSFREKFASIMRNIANRIDRA